MNSSTSIEAPVASFPRTALLGRVALAVLTLGFGAGCQVESAAPEENVGEVDEALVGGIVVNECASGSSGWIELYNAGAVTVDLANDPATCWFVDDIDGGGAPKRVTDAITNHAAGSTTCASAGRSATCGLVAPGEVVWVGYAYVNATTADRCRFISSPVAGGACSASYTDLQVGGATASSTSGQCFGRTGDNGTWGAAAMTCSKGLSNGPACAVGSACDDQNACTVGETLSAACACGGGSALSCDDANACTADACDAQTGCAHAPVADGTSCDVAKICAAGVCIDEPPPDPATTSTTGTGGAGGAGGAASGAGGDASGTGGDATGAGGSMGEGGAGEPPPPPPPAGPELVKLGAAGKIVLRGMIVQADSAFAGEVLVEGDTITCVAASCADKAGFATASIVETHGIVLPGLVDDHNHVLFDIFDESDWSPTQTYKNHNQWPNDGRYGAMVDAKQYLNGEYSSPMNVNCELDKYGELKSLVAGTTSMVGSANPGNKQCYGSLARTIDQSSNDLPNDKIQAATLFPNTSAADGICQNFASHSTDAYVVHVAEGIDAPSLAEFNKLYTVPSTDGCLHDHQTAIVHGTALGDPEFTLMGQKGMSLVWSPRSNVFLYGAGTDLTKTTNIPLALSKGINVALAPDWSIGGSQNLLDELRFADQVDNAAWGNVLTPKMLFQMATINAAKAIGLDNVIGSIAVGKKADLFVISGDAAAPYDALLAATPSEVRLVMVGGIALYGDTVLQPLAPAAPGCEALDVCSNAKFVCVAEAGGTPSNKLGQSYAELVSTLSSSLQTYDDMNLSPWNFSPIAPLVKCQ